MTTTPLFQDDAYLTECQAQVLAADDQGIVLDQTVFYPLGGGQPGDSGLILRTDGSELRIESTRKGEAGAILHLPAKGQALPEVGETVTARIDWNRRYRHMRMHTCLHLVGALLQFPVTGGNISEQKSRLDFDMEDTIDKVELTERLNALIARDHEVSTQWITDEELDAQPDLVRTMSVSPPRGVGKIRLLNIDGVDLQPCGGTHLKRTGEIGQATISKVEKKGRQNRRVHVTLAD